MQRQRQVQSQRQMPVRAQQPAAVLVFEAWTVIVADESRWEATKAS
jgi:hypothetical protein